MSASTARSSRPTGAPRKAPLSASTYGGRKSTTITAETSKSSPVPDGWPIWTSDVRPGREHDTTAARTHPEILPAFVEISDDLWTLGDLGYEGEAATITVAFKKPQNAELTDTQKVLNKAHNGIRAIGERGNALLKMTFKALRNVSLNPWRIGKIVAAALVLLHFDHARTT
jgi:DDE superfamily endonuclease